MKADEFKSGSIPNITSFAFTRIAPPSPLYLTRDDQLFLTAQTQIVGGDQVTFNWRILLPYPPTGGQPTNEGAPPPIPIVGGPAYIIQGQEVVTPTPASGAVIRRPLAEGYLLSISATSQNATDRGLTFVRAFIIRGGNLGSSGIEPLFSDYLTGLFPAGWPYGRQMSPTESSGGILEFTVANPGPGVDWSFALSGLTRMRVLSFNAQLVTSAAVANRIIRVQVKDGAAVLLWQAGPQQTVPASQTVQVSGGAGQVTTTVDTTTVNLALSGTVMLQGGSIGVSTLNIQGADQWSNIRLSMEQWLVNV